MFTVMKLSKQINSLETQTDPCSDDKTGQTGEGDIYYGAFVFCGLYSLQLVQHLAHNDDTRPDSANTRSKGSVLAVGQREGPRRQEHIVEQRHLHRRQHRR